MQKHHDNEIRFFCTSCKIFFLRILWLPTTVLRSWNILLTPTPFIAYRSSSFCKFCCTGSVDVGEFVAKHWLKCARSTRHELFMMCHLQKALGVCSAKALLFLLIGEKTKRSLPCISSKWKHHNLVTTMNRISCSECFCLVRVFLTQRLQVGHRAFKRSSNQTLKVRNFF